MMPRSPTPSEPPSAAPEVGSGAANQLDTTLQDQLAGLLAEFPREIVSWRAQNVTQNGDKALALAYIDARDVMRRLDDVLGPQHWEDSYVETPSGRLICTIKVRLGEEWISKSDGAGNTDVEGDKGAISDAFKRCAVKWGIGRYLYDLESPWVPCESYEANGKKRWKRWTVDPWTCVRAVGTPPPAKRDAPFPPGPARNKTDLKGLAGALWKDIEACDDPDQFEALIGSHSEMLIQVQKALPLWWSGGVHDNGEKFDGLGQVIDRVRREFESGQPQPRVLNPLTSG